MEPQPQEQLTGDADTITVEEYTPDDPPILVNISQSAVIPQLSPILEGGTPSLSEAHTDTGTN